MLRSFALFAANAALATPLYHKLPVPVMRNATVLAGATNSSSPAADQLDQLVTDDVSSCSDTWMAVNDVEIGGGTDDRTGFNSAVRRFCDAADGKIVKEDGYLSMATETFLSAGKDPSSYGILGYVYFEVHNKESGDHTVESSACQEHLGKLSAVGSKCYGAEHKDTKGGTYQVGTMAISYHAFGKAVPPTEKTALNNIFEGQALTAQTVNTGGAAPLNPWPLDSLSAVKPVPCHSHNDYDRSIPLFESLAAGCIGTEADVWLSGGDVIIGHILPKPGRTLRAQYVEPLVQIISHNGGSVYKSAPQQTLTLLIDFKTSDTKTLDAVVRALEPLREAGYLSRRDPTTGEFLRGAVTVSASGSAPFDRISQGDGVPNRDVFYDAPLGNLAGGNYTKDKGSFTASADFQDAVSPDANIGADELAKLRDQVGKAHDRGLVARYWNLPSDSIWEQLRAEGVDLLNGDDMKATARLPRLGQEMKRFRLGGPIFRFIRT